jgi:pilus assembly protein CpaB
VNKPAFIIAVASTVFGAAAGHLYMAQVEHEAAGGGKMAVLIATSDLKPGSVLTEGHLGVREIPQAYVGSRNISAKEAKRIVGIRLSTQIKANEPILWSDVAALGTDARDLSSSVQDGHRAFAMSGQTTFDGLLRPGDRVDLLFFQSESGKTRVLLQDVLVLAIGGQLDATRASRSGNGGVVISVDLREAQIVGTAERAGIIRLVLRNPNDVQNVEKLPETSRDEILGVVKAEEKTGAAPAASDKKKEIERVQSSVRN